MPWQPGSHAKLTWNFQSRQMAPCCVHGLALVTRLGAFALRDKIDDTRTRSPSPSRSRVPGTTRVACDNDCRLLWTRGHRMCLGRQIPRSEQSCPGAHQHTERPQPPFHYPGTPAWAVRGIGSPLDRFNLANQLHRNLEMNGLVCNTSSYRHLLYFPPIDAEILLRSGSLPK